MRYEYSEEVLIEQVFQDELEELVYKVVFIKIL